MDDGEGSARRMTCAPFCSAKNPDENELDEALESVVCFCVCFNGNDCGLHVNVKYMYIHVYVHVSVAL